MPAPRKILTYNVVLLAIILAFTLYEELHLRRWLFHHYGSNSIVAGSLPNFLAVLVFSAAIAVIKSPHASPQPGRATFQIVATVAAALIAYEIAQIWLPHRTFDWNDIYATLIGAATAWLLLAFLRIPRNMETKP